MTPDTDKIIDKVRKLLALAERNTNENEAAVAASKAQDLLLKHNLTMSQIETVATKEAITQVTRNANNSAWVAILLNGVCKYNFCRVVRGHHYVNGKNTSYFIIFGTASNIEVAEYLFNYVYREIIRLCPQGGKSFTDSFKKGAASKVVDRMRRTFEDFQVATSDTKALVLVRNADVALAVEHAYPKLGTHKVQPSRSTLGYYAGVKAGENIALNKAIKGSTTNAAGQLLIGAN